MPLKTAAVIHPPKKKTKAGPNQYALPVETTDTAMRKLSSPKVKPFKKSAAAKRVKAVKPQQFTLPHKK
jgi:hypothetical protein